MPATYVKSLNGYNGSRPFAKNEGVVIDAGDIHISGSTGNTITQEISFLAQSMTILELEQLEPETDFRIRIGSYQLQSEE
jgi:hypothetical protein